ncbi:hypothetical protein GCM10011608_52330 [Micromonospora sonchi]|uniref:Flavin reductase n=1 Tax=Micromonospora sonchi TaxID=1763543 RepID=A0A917U6E7_9ACTN|nr:hypothetical protein [Micromonospora sonchi]GGM60792.1 hypothetical protein GCM10011608_52330 [Micromonospora sonchi]
MTSQSHLPLRPLWLCRICAAPWPCSPARLTLLAGYRHDRVALSIYLAAMLYDAVDDLYRLDPQTVPKPATLHDRFLGWAAPRTPRPQSSA